MKNKQKIGDLILLDLGRYKYRAIVNMDQTLLVEDYSAAAVDNVSKKVSWFGADAHKAIKRLAYDMTPIWPLAKPIKTDFKLLVQTFELMMKRIPIQKRTSDLMVVLINNDRFSAEEFEIIVKALKKTGYCVDDEAVFAPKFVEEHMGGVLVDEPVFLTGLKSTDY